MVILAGVNHDRGTVLITERSWTWIDGDIRQEILNRVLRARGHLDVRQIPGVGSAWIQKAMLTVGGIEMATCRLERRTVTTSHIMNMQAVDPRSRVLQIQPEQDAMWRLL